LKAIYQLTKSILIEYYISERAAACLNSMLWGRGPTTYITWRQDDPIQTKAVYLALGITVEGEKELLDLWRSESEGAKF